MQRRSLALVLVVVLAACSGGQANPPGGGSSAGTGSGGAGASAGTGGGGGGGGGGGSAGLAAAAAKVTDWCALIPMDVITPWAPSAPPVTKGVYPGECATSNGKAALDFRYSTGFGHFESPNPAQVVPGLGVSAFAQPAGVDEVQLWVVLEDTDAGNAQLFIDVAGHDGKDHIADAVAIAQAVLGKLK